MPRGFRGNTRASPRGRGRGRGFNRGRGRGGGFQHHPFDDEMDVVVQVWDQNNSGNSTPRGRGRGGGRGANFDSGRGTPHRGRGSSPAPRASASIQSPARGRGFGRGRGGPPPKLSTFAPLSKLLFAERPLLKPVTFVRSVHTATLFQEEEELVNNVAEEMDETEQSHVPTAERITQIFSGANLSDDDNDELEEVDFDDLARIRAEVDATSSVSNTASTSKLKQDQFTGYYAETKVSTVETASSTVVEQVTQDVFYVDTTPAPVHDSGTLKDSQTPIASIESQLNVISIGETTYPDVNMAAPENKQEPFYVDTTPAPVPPEMASSHAPVVPEPPPIDDDDDVIVYLAPHPRARTTPAIPLQTQPSPPTPPAHESVSFSFANSPAPKLGNRKAPAVNTPRGKRQALKAARQKSARMPKRRAKGGFSSFGAMLSEARLHDEEDENRDPLFEARRRGDSDVDWGDEDESGDGIAEGMQLDDEMLDDKAMKSFVQSMSPGGSQWVGAGDIEDMQRIQAEDEEDGENATDSGSEESEDEAGDLEVVFEAEERMVIGEDSESDDMDESDNEDEDTSPRSNFQARLDRIRKNARSKKPRHVPVSSEEEDDYDGLGTWADEDEDFMAEIEDILAENEAILSGRDRKKRNRLFQAIRDGDFDDDAEELDELMFLPASKKAKRNGLPAELVAQWDKDRSKKADRKRLREQAKLMAAADPLTTKKGGKKGRKAMLAAARLAGDPITVLPNQIMSMVTLEQQIRRFLQDLGGRNEMVLPPMDKSTRKQVHEMANAFNLKSVSKGSGKTRYTTLIKTTRSGFVINEKKVARITKMGWGAPSDWDRGGKGKTQLPKHRDGDEVGKAAPKIGESNIGFQMLASMGWSEGDRIGISGGLDAPLTAIIKNTKLGLGATR